MLRTFRAATFARPLGAAKISGLVLPPIGDQMNCNRPFAGTIPFGCHFAPFFGFLLMCDMEL